MTPPKLLARPVVVTFSQNVRARRQAAGLSQPKLADLAYIRAAFIGKIERQKANPSLITMALIARALGCTLVDLLTPSDAS